MKDFDQDLAALRFVIEKKARGEHLKKILAENAEYTSVSWKETFTGPQEIIRLLNHVQDTGSEKEFAHYAVIIKNDGHAKEIENNKVGILRGAQAQFEQGVITKEQHKEIKDIVGFFPTIMLFW